MTPQEFLTWLKELIEASAPALAVMLWNYKEAELIEQKNKTLDAQVNLEIEKNHESVNDKYVDAPDLSVVDDAIKSGGGQSIESSPTSSTKPSS